MTQLLEADAEDRFAGAHEILVAGDVVRRQLPDRGAHFRRVARVVERGAVVEANTVERRDRPQFDVVGQPLAAQLPQFLEQERCSDDGGARVEREAVLAENVGAAAGCIELLQDGRPIAAGAQANGSGQPAESAADDDRVRAPVIRA